MISRCGSGCCVNVVWRDHIKSEHNLLTLHTIYWKMEWLWKQTHSQTERLKYRTYQSITIQHAEHSFKSVIEIAWIFLFLNSCTVVITACCLHLQLLCKHLNSKTAVFTHILPVKGEKKRKTYSATQCAFKNHSSSSDAHSTCSY